MTKLQQVTTHWIAHQGPAFPETKETEVHPQNTYHVYNLTRPVITRGLSTLWCRYELILDTQRPACKPSLTPPAVHQKEIASEQGWNTNRRLRPKQMSGSCALRSWRGDDGKTSTQDRLPFKSPNTQILSIKKCFYCSTEAIAAQASCCNERQRTRGPHTNFFSTCFLRV